ncbi:MAG: ribonuclease P [Candidatus Aenigmarchaeota archaeon]|nr:ribonuclease P [Candidatus Aenigmarchaeota archaeon]
MIPPRWRRIASERIRILFRLAREESAKHPERSKRYVELALVIAKKYKVRLPKKLKRSYCHECHAFWRIGTNVTVRLNARERVVSYVCKECGKERRYPYGQEV